MDDKPFDLYKEFRGIWNPGAKPVIVDVPALPCLMANGQGNPNDNPLFQARTEALFGIAYGLKFWLSKDAEGKALAAAHNIPDWKVPSLEGLWWADDMASFGWSQTGNNGIPDKSAWYWTLLIPLPPFITEPIFQQGCSALIRKKKELDIASVRYELFTEGRCAQLMHTGSYDAEAPRIKELHEFIEAQGFNLRGIHHEIYLGDPRRTAPERLKTIIRQPC